MKICMIGTGYVGLVSGACFADLGNNVICVDKDAEKIDMLNNNQIPIYEPGLEELVFKNFSSGRLKFTTNLNSAVKNSDIIFICVGTPVLIKNGSADLKFVFSVANEIKKYINKYKIIVTKSTVPITTGDKIEKIISKSKKRSLFEVISNPEFLREGEAIRDFRFPDRIVIGSNSKKAVKKMENLYDPLIKKGAKFFYTNRRGAELIKYASNAFLSTKITFINEIADLCENIDAEVETVAKAIGLDGRIGPKFLHPGPGYGGSCFPKDVKSLIYQGNKNLTDLKIIKAVDKANELRIQSLFKKIKKITKNKFSNIQIGLLGITFKPNTDDVRESPAVKLAKSLSKTKAKIKIFDPKGMENAKKELPKSIKFCENENEVIKNSSLLVILTEWNQFKNLDLLNVKKLMKKPIILDLRNIYSKEITKLGFKYYSIGNN